MVVVMETTATQEMVDHVMKIIHEHGLKADVMYGDQRVAIGVLGDRDKLEEGQVVRLPGVKEILLISKPYKKVSREYKPDDTVVKVRDVEFGTNQPVIIAGPCTVESEEQLMEIAEGVKKLGVQMLRGGAFKPRTSPYSFQGLGKEGLKYLKKASEKTGLPVVSEIMSTEDLDAFLEYDIDMLQIGARNMQNFDMLKRLAKVDKPVLLKRGMSATVEEFLLAAEYFYKEGNHNVVLCERGIRTFENSTRNILDLNSLALIREISHLPIIADPSHAAGRYDLVAPLGIAAVAAGANGLIVETHNRPDEALCDGKQSLKFDTLEGLIKRIRQITSS